jgi:hypothetical protein
VEFPALATNNRLAWQKLEEKRSSLLCRDALPRRLAATPCRDACDEQKSLKSIETRRIGPTGTLPIMITRPRRTITPTGPTLRPSFQGTAWS